MTKDVYLATIERMEPEISPVDAAAFYASAAISLKRIADSLERLSTVDGIANLLKDLQPIIEALDK